MQRVPPEHNPEADHEASHHGEDHGDEQIHEEWEEGPANEDEDEGEDDNGVSDKPGDEESAAAQHGPEDEEQGSEEVGRGGRHQWYEDQLGVLVKPVQAGQHSPDHLGVPVIAAQPGLQPSSGRRPRSRAYQAVHSRQQYSYTGKQGEGGGKEEAHSPANAAEAQPAPSSTSSSSHYTENACLIVVLHKNLIKENSLQQGVVIDCGTLAVVT